MERRNKRHLAVAALLSAMAGYIDALGFLQLKGYFVSFMSGNSTRLSVGLMLGDSYSTRLLGSIIALFVAGAFIGTLLRHTAPPSRQSLNVLAFVSLMLLVAATLQQLNCAYAAIACMTLAMGAENIAFQQEGSLPLGLTYMTGTLVKVGQKLAEALLGKNKFAWLPNLLLWIGLIGGGAAGVLAFYYIGLGGLWIAVVWSLAATLLIGQEESASSL